MDKKAYELYKLAVQNTNIIHKNDPNLAEIGYKAYWDLEQYVKEHRLDDAVLADLAADFAWDDRLHKACKRYDKKYGKKDYIKYRGILFDPTDSEDEIENELWELVIDAKNNNELEDLITDIETTFYKYPNVLKRCEAWRKRFLS